jgi:ubiquinone/menaquinone biosynthesis C-methylase UbiE
MRWHIPVLVRSSSLNSSNSSISLLSNCHSDVLRSLWWHLIRFGFRLLYNELAWTYDLVSKVVSLGQWRHWQCAGIPYLNLEPGQSVLELAQGTGNVQIELLEAGYQPVGLDLSRSMGHFARRKLLRLGLPANLVRGNALRLPFGNRSFDAVFSTFPTDFFIRTETLSEVWRVLKPGGRFVVVINGLLTSRHVSARVIESLYRVTGQRGPWPGKPQKRIESAGFTYEYRIEEQAHSQVLMIIASRPLEEML